MNIYYYDEAKKGQEGSSPKKKFGLKWKRKEKEREGKERHLQVVATGQRAFKEQGCQPRQLCWLVS